MTPQAFCTTCTTYHTLAPRTRVHITPEHSKKLDLDIDSLTTSVCSSQAYPWTTRRMSSLRVEGLVWKTSETTSKNLLGELPQILLKLWVIRLLAWIGHLPVRNDL